MFTKLAKWRTFSVDDGLKRGPLCAYRVRFHPDGKRLIAACSDRRIAVWELDGPEEKSKAGESAVVGRLVCPHEVGWVRGLDASADVCFTGGSDRRLRRWPWRDGKAADTPSHDIAAHDGWVEAVALAPDGKRVVTGGADGRVKVWAADDLAAVKTLEGHTAPVRDLAWTADGKWLVSGGEDGRLLVWDSATWERAREIGFGDAHDSAGQNPALAGVHRLSISPDSKWLIAAGGKKAGVYELATGTFAVTEKAETQAAFGPAGELLVVGSETARVLTYDATRFRPGKPDKQGIAPPTAGLPAKELGTIKLGSFALGLAFSNDARRLACGRSDGRVEVWELS